MKEPRALVAGDFFICGGCATVLRLDENTQPVIPSIEEIEQLPEPTLMGLAIAKAVVLKQRQEGA